MRWNFLTPQAARNNSEHNTPFHIAAFYGHADCLRVLVKAASLLMNTRNKSGMTPLLLAAQKGYAQCVKTLVDAGADLNLPVSSHISILLSS